MKKLFLGIDQSFTSTGICVVDEDLNIAHHETINTSDADGDIYERCLKVIDRIEEVTMIYAPIRLGLEGLAFSKFGNATRDLAGLQFAIITHLRFRKSNRCKDMQIVSPNLLKKFATGSGSADKDKMYEAVPEAAKETFKGYKKTKGRSDVVDAYWLACYTRMIYNSSQTKLDNAQTI